MKKLPGRMALLPRHGIYYTTSDHVDNERFVRVWREAWARIPLWARRDLLAYWRTLDGFEQGIAPRFFCYPTLTNEGEPNECLGVWKVFNGATEYDANAVNIMPDSILQTLIAHELAHPVYCIRESKEHPEVYPHRHETFSKLSKSEEYGGDFIKEMEEQDVREIQDAWGFDEGEFCDWIEVNLHRIKEAESRQEVELQAYIAQRNAANVSAT